MSLDFSPIKDALEAYKAGGPVIVMDDDSRENEGDIIINGKSATDKHIAFMQNYTTGIMCPVITKQKAKRLHLAPMVVNNSEYHNSAF